MNLKENGMMIGEKHSFRDFGMIMTSKQISAPEAQIKKIEVPGRNGMLDLSETLTGNVKYNSRTIKATFYVPKKPLEWTSFVSELRNEYEGQKKQIVFDDDLAFYWIGRTSIDFTNNGTVATITITANVDPYKYTVISDAKDWLWDPFDFEQGVINEFYNLTVNGTLEVEVLGISKYANPIIISDSCMTVEFEGNSYSIIPGSQVMYGIVLSSTSSKMKFIGNGVISINVVGGSL